MQKGKVAAAPIVYAKTHRMIVSILVQARIVVVRQVYFRVWGQVFALAGER